MAYDAFISYRHGSDDVVAAAIERGLERLARPWNRLRAMSVFRDESELGAAVDLTGAIKRALGEARYLVLLASPESAGSPWVDKEVDHWFDDGEGASRVILVLTAGEFAWDDDAGAPAPSSSAISPSVRARITTEPVYVDLRWARSAPELSLRDSRFRAEIVRIAATIRGIPPADLESEDIRIHRRARRLARGAVAVVTVLALVASIAAVAAVANARRADRRARDAVARQAGLAALDLPAADVDEAFLLSLAAADLDSDRSGEQFHASRVLVGRNARLAELRYAPAGTASVRDIAMSGDGNEIVAVATAADGAPVLLSWAAGDRTPTERALDPGSATLLALDDDRLGVLGDESARLELADAAGTATSSLAGVIAVDPAAGVAVTAARDEPTRLVTVEGDVVARSDLVPSSTDVGFGRAAFATADGAIVVLDPSGAATTTAAGRVDAVAAGPSDEVAAVTAAARRVTTWRRSGGELAASAAATIPPDVGVVDRLIVSADGERVLLVGAEGSAVITVVADEVEAVDAGATGIARPDPSGRYVAVGGARLAVWDLATGRSVHSSPTPANDLAWAGPCVDESTCILVSVGRSLDAWYPLTRRHVPLAETTNAQTVALSADGSTIVAAGWGPVVGVWQLRPVVDDRGRTVVPIAVAGPPGDCLGGGGAAISARSPDGSLVVAHRASDRRTAVCDALTGEQIAVAAISAAVPALPASAVAVADDGNIALGGGDGFVAQFPRDGATFGFGTIFDARLGGEVTSVSSLAYDGRTVVAGTRPGATGSSGRVLVWQVADGAAPVGFDADFAEIPAVAILAEGGLIAVAGRDEAEGPVTVQTWETDTLRRLGHGLGGLAGDIVSLSGDAASVTAADATGRAFRWELDRDPRRDICAVVGRDLTDAEWQTVADGALRPYEERSVCPGVSNPGG